MNHLAVTKDGKILLSIPPIHPGYCEGCSLRNSYNTGICQCLHDEDDPTCMCYIPGKNYYIWKNLKVCEV